MTLPAPVRRIREFRAPGPDRSGRAWARTVLLAAFLAIAMSASAVAAPGDLDPSYGVGGIAVADGATVPDSSSLGVTVGIHAEDTSVVTVTTGSDGSRMVAVVNRTLGDGTPDATFNGTGRVVVAVGDVGADNTPVGVVSRPDGRVVIGIVGRSGKLPALFLVQLTAAGALDPGFGAGGVAGRVIPRLTVSSISTSSGAAGPVLHPDGSVTLVGAENPVFSAAASTGNNIVAFRVDGAGSPVAGFGAGGLATVPVPTSMIPSAALAAGGDVIVAGPPAVSTLPLTSAVLRLGTGGAPVGTFGTGGIATYPGSSPMRMAAVPGSDDVFVAHVTTGAWELHRVTPTGAEAAGFPVTTATPAPLSGVVVRQGINQVILGGTAAGVRVLRKFNLTGGGILYATGAEPAALNAHTLGIPPNGVRVLLAGTALAPTRAGATVAYTGASGVLDGTFTATSVSPGTTAIRAITSASAAAASPAGVAYLAATGPGGSAFRVFTAGGLAGPLTPSGFGPTTDVLGLSRDTAGRILVAAREPTPAKTLTTARLTSALGPDPTFATATRTVSADFPFPVGIVQVGGRVVTAAFGFFTGAVRCEVTATNAAGAPDPGFGVGGLVVLGAPCGGILPFRGGFVTWTTFENGPERRARLHAFTANGQPMASFGSSGVKDVAIGQFGTGIVAAAPAPRNGLIIALHRVAVSGGPGAFDIGRLLPNGNPDPTFGSAGFTRVLVTNGVTPSGRVATLPDGSVGAAWLWPFDAPELSTLVLTPKGRVPGSGVRQVVLGPSASLVTLGALTDGRFLLAGGADTRLLTARLLGNRPSGLTRAADRLRRTAVRVAGRVIPRGGRTVWWVEYGRTKKYGRRTPKRAIGGAKDVIVRTTLGRLRPNTRYHYRIVVENGSGRSVGANRTFRTRR